MGDGLRTTQVTMPSSRSGPSHTDSSDLDGPSSFSKTSDLPPLSPIRDSHSGMDCERKPRSWWRSPTRADDQSRWPERTASIRTTSTTDSGSTLSSSTSRASRASAATAPAVDMYRLPVSPSEDGNDNEYIGAPMKPFESCAHIPALNSLGESPEELDEDAIPASTVPRVVEQHKTLPIMARRESRLESRAGFRSPENDLGVPLAEIEMMPRKYQGYWRASFTANIPVAAAMSGCLLLAAGTSVSPGFKQNEDTLVSSNTLISALTEATSPATLLEALFTHNFRDALFALKTSMASSILPVVPAKIAFQMYKDLSEANENPKKRQKVWEKAAKLLRKVPQETIVPLMFLVAIGRRLKARQVTVDGVPAGVFIMQGLWPQIGSKALFALDKSAGDAVSALLLERHDEIPDELPSILQAVNYRFESGSRCNLMGLLMSKKGSGTGGKQGGTGSSGG